MNDISFRLGRRMIPFRFFVVFGVSIWVSACGATIARNAGINFVDTPTSSESVKGQTQIEWDEHQQITSYTAPIVFAAINIFSDFYFLRAFVPSVGNVAAKPNVIQLYVVAVIGDWAFYDRAYASGKQLSLTEIDRRVSFCSGAGGCTLHEEVAINLSMEDLITYSSTGLAFEISGRGGKKEFSVPSGYFSGFYAALTLDRPLHESQGEVSSTETN